MLLLLVARQRVLLPFCALTSTASPFIVSIKLILLITPARKRVIQLPAPRTLFPACAAVLLHARGQTLGLLLVEQLKLVRIARRVSEATPARHVQINAKSGAEDENQRERGVNPGLGARADAKGRQEAGEPGRIGGGGGGGRSLGRGVQLTGVECAGGGRFGIDGAVRVVGRVASNGAVGWGGDETWWRGDSGWRDSSGGDRVMVVVVFFSGHWKKGSFAGIDRFAPELQVPIDPSAIELVDFGVLDDDGPGAFARFAPAKESQL